MLFHSGGAVGNAAMGITAENVGLSPTLTIATAGLALGPLAALAWRFRPIPPEDLLPAGDWPAPQLSSNAWTEAQIACTRTFACSHTTATSISIGPSRCRLRRTRELSQATRVWCYAR
jgi:Transmembrane secretion effector